MLTFFLFNEVYSTNLTGQSKAEVLYGLKETAVIR